jgi:hypothetical protein
MSLKRIRIVVLGVLVAAVAAGPPIWFVVLGNAPVSACPGGETLLTSPSPERGQPSATVGEAVRRAVADVPSAPARDEIGTVVRAAGVDEAPAGDIVLDFSTVDVTVIKGSDGTFSPVDTTRCVPSPPVESQVSIRELA